MARSSLQTFFLVVHGETEADLQGKVCGSGWDPALTPAGLAQARQIAKRFTRDKQGIKVIFSSPMLRCIQTTDVIHDNLKVKVRVLSPLQDRGFGPHEKSLASAFDFWMESIPGGENLNRFQTRVREFASFLSDHLGTQPGTALVVTHPLFAKALASALSVEADAFQPGIIYRLERESPTGPWALGGDRDQ